MEVAGRQARRSDLLRRRCRSTNCGVGTSEALPHSGAISSAEFSRFYVQKNHFAISHLLCGRPLCARAREIAKSEDKIISQRGNVVKVRVLDDDILVPTEMLAKIYGVSSRTINLWTKTGCPKQGRGAYSLRDVAQWIRAGIPEEEKEVSKMTLAQQKLFQESRHRAALADMQEMRMRSMMGELMPVQQVTDDLRRFCGVLKKELYSIGRELLAEVETEITPERARDLDERMTKRLEAALRQLSAGEFRYGGE